MLKRLRVLPFLLLAPLAAMTPAMAQTETLDKPSNAPVEEQPPAIKAVLELFTSQGCSSCPPADKLLKKYTERKDVIALSLPIDYWDYIGWKDTFASPKNTQRQRAYASTVTDGPIYTPQIIVNGRADALGSSENQIEYAIAITKDELEKERIPIKSWHNENTIIIQIPAVPDPAKIEQTTIWLARVQPSASVEIKAGENRGRSLNYYNVVREMIPVGSWNGQAMNIRLDRKAIMFPKTEKGAVLLQKEVHGPIIGATWLGN